MYLDALDGADDAVRRCASSTVKMCDRRRGRPEFSSCNPPRLKGEPRAAYLVSNGVGDDSAVTRYVVGVALLSVLMSGCGSPISDPVPVRWPLLARPPRPCATDVACCPDALVGSCRVGCRGIEKRPQLHSQLGASREDFGLGAHLEGQEHSEIRDASRSVIFWQRWCRLKCSCLPAA